jgi:hypothetical protein
LIEQASELDEKISVAKGEKRKKGTIRRKKDAVLDDSRGVVENLMMLKSIKNDGRLTLKRLITMGSPIAMMALRSNQWIRYLAYGRRISLASIGLVNTRAEEDSPSWVNIWNKYDPISFPVEPIVEEGSAVKDFHSRIAWNPLMSHTGYWQSKNVHRILARLL